MYINRYVGRVTTYTTAFMLTIGIVAGTHVGTGSFDGANANEQQISQQTDAGK